MEEHKVLDQKIGAEAVLKVVVLDKHKFQVNLDYDGKQLDAGMYANISIAEVLQAYVDSTETEFDDKALATVKAILGIA